MHRFPSLGLKSRIDAALRCGVGLQAKRFFFAATKIRIRRGPRCCFGRFRRNHSPLRRRRLESDAKPCCRHGRCRRNHSALRRRRLESDAEIRCRKYHTLSKSPARVPSCVDDASCLGCLHGAGSTRLRQWRQKRVLMRPEAAFPYVFAAEGAQHPPKRPPRSTAIAAAPA